MRLNSAHGGRYLICSAVVVILDQLTKYLVVHSVPAGGSGWQLLPFFSLVHVYNEGAAFSFLADRGGWQRYLFMATAVIIVAVLVWYLLRLSRSKFWTCLSVALVIGGALGNLIDRVVLGHVVDFLHFYLRGPDYYWSYPAFNVADIAVCTGAGLLVLQSLFERKSPEKAGQSS
ncbi:MAG: lipoprotein signal peptidase [Succinivibrio sp.]|nr:lipoprotein signal peptidase [Succinivibrio sp.]